MFIIKYYLLAALLTLLAATLFNNLAVTIILVWVASSLLLVSLAYLTDLPAIFRKNQDGKLSRWIRWLFLPFLFGVTLYNYFSRKNDSVPAIQEVQPNLFVSSRLTSKDIGTLKSKKIGCIVDVTAEFAGLESAITDKSFQYITIPTLDHSVPSIRKLAHAMNWIETQLNHSEKVVVHCALGRGRSIFVIAAYLLLKDPKLSVEQVLKQLNTIRHTAKLNASQLRTLHKIHSSAKLSLVDPIYIIANPVSGGGKWPHYRHQIIHKLTQKFPLVIKETTPQTSAQQLTKEAIENGANTIVACGGDGTVTEVASELINSDVKLGIMPMGTANALSHVLYGFTSKISPIPHACDALLANETTNIDTAICNDQLMLLVLGIGFEQQMIEYAHRQQKNNLGQLAYLTGFFNAVLSDEAHEIKIKVDNSAEQSLTIESLVVANIAPFSTVLAQAGDKPDIRSGSLQVSILKQSDDLSERIKSIADLISASVNVKEKADYFDSYSAKTIEINADQPIPYVIDGELFEDSSISIKVQPNSLKVFKLG